MEKSKLQENQRSHFIKQGPMVPMASKLHRCMGMRQRKDTIPTGSKDCGDMDNKEELMCGMAAYLVNDSEYITGRHLAA